jgi:hypothetical protein
LLLKENQRRFQAENPKVLGANRNLLAFLKDYHFTIDTQNTFPTVLNCFFSIRNGSFSDELHEFRKYNPEMTIILPKHLYSPVWVREVLAEV